MQKERSERQTDYEKLIQGGNSLIQHVSQPAAARITSECEEVRSKWRALFAAFGESAPSPAGSRQEFKLATRIVTTTTSRRTVERGEVITTEQHVQRIAMPTSSGAVT